MDNNIPTTPRWKPLSKHLREGAPFGRTRYYELINSGKIRAKKQGATTLVDLASEYEYIDSLPDYGKAA